MFSKALIVSGLAALATAQSAVLSFTKVPNPVTDGQPQAITYATNDTSSPVTIILRKGLSTNLQTISTLTTSATNGQFIWTPSTSLADGIDYALEITQGTQVNYFGPFVVQGASASAVSSASSASSASGSATAYISSTVSANGTASTTIPVAPGTIGTMMSAGTGTALPRNTTMSMATLTSSATSAGSPSSNTAAATSGAGFQGTSTASAAFSSSTSGATGVQVGSVLSLVFGAAAAAFYL